MEVLLSAAHLCLMGLYSSTGAFKRWCPDEESWDGRGSEGSKEEWRGCRLDG